MLNRKLLNVAFAIAFFVIASPIETRADHDGTLDYRIQTQLFDYDILIDNDEPYDCTADPTPEDANLNYFPVVQGWNAALGLDSGQASLPGIPAGYHLGYTNLGFMTPDFNDQEDEILIYNCAPGSVHDDAHCDNGRANSERIILPSTSYCARSELSIRKVMGHELFHHVEFAAGVSSSKLGSVAIEGTARMMEDQIYTDADLHPSTAFVREIAKYFGDPGIGFWNLSYKSALGWKHLAEQYGQIATEPEIGSDFIQTFWEIVADNAASPDVPGTIESAIQEFSPDTSLEEWFQDFTIANIAKDFDASGLSDPGKYRYIDEDNPGMAYGQIKRFWEGNITDNPLFSTVLNPWAASYNEADIGADCPVGFIFGFRVYSSRNLKISVLPIVAPDTIEQIVQGAGDNFAAAFIQRGSGPGDPYTKLLTVLTGTDTFGVAEWTFACGPGDMEILSPDAAYIAHVGPKETPRPLLIRLLVTGPEELSDTIVLGLQPTDFTVYVGDNFAPNDSAEILNGAYVDGQYWLTVRPPVKNTEGVFDLHVTKGAFHFDSEVDAVSYEERVFDQMLVIDTSGSMSAPAASPKIDAAKNGASLFVDLAIANDELGLVNFNSDATVQAPLQAATDSQRNIIISRINALTEFGNTSIGDGLDLAAEQLNVNGSAVGEDWIVLMSDGQENEPLSWVQVEQDIIDAGIRISTIALGEDADQVLMQEIADETGGNYYYVDVGSVQNLSEPDEKSDKSNENVGSNTSLANQLADAYAAANELMTKRQRLFNVSGQLQELDTQDYTLRIDGDGIVDGLFIIQWSDSADSIDVRVIRPDGSTVADGINNVEIFMRSTHVVVQVADLEEGDWRIDLAAHTGDPEYIVIASGDDRRGAELNVNFGQSFDPTINSVSGGHYLRGLPVPIRATLHDSAGNIAGAQIIAQIEHPNGSIQTLPLFDDGEHSDGFKGDSVYGNQYAKTTEFSLNDLPDVAGTGMRGSYNVVVEAQGSDNTDHGFTRIKKLSFQVLEIDHITGLGPSDTDDDGMPDRYEELHDCLNPFFPDASSDGDEDGLLNLGSYLLGLSPCHSDTDRGGETDMSEIARGANPFDPGDDSIHNIIDAEVIDWIYEHLPEPGPQDLLPEANLIRYQVHASYDQIRLLRSLNSNGPFALVATFDPHQDGGLYLDAGLVNGTTYFYRLQPVGATGNVAAPSHVFSGTPNADPIPPIGSVLINKGASRTTDAVALLSMVASSDTVSVKIANEPTFEGHPWVPIQSTFPWVLEPDPQKNNIATIYVKFLDENNNESPSVYHASIQVVDPLSVATLAGRAFLEGQTDHANIFVTPVRPSDVSPDFTSDQATFELTHLEPGTYDIHYSYPGYGDEVVTGVIVVAGQTTMLPDTILLLLADIDQDGVPDSQDNCTRVVNPDQRDTNGDGFGNICDPDLNNDGQVNFADISAWVPHFNTANNGDEDFNGDGQVNFSDYFIITQFFLLPPGPSGLAL